MRAFTSNPPTLALAATVLLMACGSYGGPSGGGDGLPSRAIGPWDFVRASDAPDAPKASVLPEDASAGRLFGHRLDDGRVVLLRTEEEEAGWRLRKWTSDDGRSFAPERTLLAEADLDGELDDLHAIPWHEQWLVVGVTPAGHPRLAIRQGDDEWTTLAPIELPETLRLASPTLVAAHDQLYLWAVDISDEGPRRLVRLHALDVHGPWTREETDFAGGVDCVGTNGRPAPCWDREGPLTFDIRAAHTPLGRPLWRIWYTSGSSRSLPGFAASWDGVTWSRFVFNPLLAEEGGQWRWPVSLRTTDGALLYGERQTSRGAPGVVAGSWIAVGSADTW